MIIAGNWIFLLFLLIASDSDQFVWQLGEVFVRKYQYNKQGLIRTKQYWKILALDLQNVAVNWFQSAIKVNSSVKIYTCRNVKSRDCRDRSWSYTVNKRIIKNYYGRLDWLTWITYHSFDGLSWRILPNDCACNIRLSSVIARKGVTGQPAACNARAVHTLQVLNKW